jgi:hypothetical protein
MNKYLLQSEFLMEFFINQKEYDDFRKKIIKFIHFLEKEESFIDNKYKSKLFKISQWKKENSMNISNKDSILLNLFFHQKNFFKVIRSIYG